MYFYRDPKAKPDTEAGRVVGTAIELKLINRIRAQVKKWRLEGYPSVTRTTLELLQWWQRDGRAQRLFFAQLDAVETIIFSLRLVGICGKGSMCRKRRSVPRNERKASRGFGGMRARWRQGPARPR